MLDLRKLFPSLRVTLDPSADSWADIWAQEIRGKAGTVYAASDTLLAVEVDHHPKTRKALAALGFRCSQDGDRESTFLVPLDRAAEALALVRPRRKRTLSPEHRQRLAEAGRHSRFRPGSAG